MDKQSKEELIGSMEELEEVKKELNLESNDTALLLLIYNEIMNHDNALRDI